MKWFKHDSNAHIDAKLKKVKHKYGIVGYGLYWYCVELIAMGVDKNNITFELEEDSETIAMEWNLDQLKVQEMMEYMVHLNLFENHEGRITCLKLAKRLDDTNSKNPEIKRVLAQLGEPVPPAPAPNEPDSLGETPKDSAQTRLDEIRLEEVNKVKSRFNDFWNIYPRRQKKQVAKGYWEKKIQNIELADLIIDHVSTRKKKDPSWLKENGQYIPLATTFLNQALWEDEYGVVAIQPNPSQKKPKSMPKAGSEQ